MRIENRTRPRPLITALIVTFVLGALITLISGPQTPRLETATSGDAQLAAQQIGLQLWTFCALFLDATAIAAQALIGRLLGSSALEVAAAGVSLMGTPPF